MSGDFVAATAVALFASYGYRSAASSGSNTEIEALESKIAATNIAAATATAGLNEANMKLNNLMANHAVMIAKQDQILAGSTTYQMVGMEAMNGNVSSGPVATVVNSKINEIQQLGKDCHDAQVESNKYSTALAAANKEVTRLKDALRDEKIKHELTRSQCESAEAHSVKLHAQLATSQDALKAISTNMPNIIEQEKQISALQDHVNAKDAEIERLKDEAARALVITKADQLEEENEALRSTNYTTEQMLDASKTQISRLKAAAAEAAQLREVNEAKQMHTIEELRSAKHKTEQILDASKAEICDLKAVIENHDQEKKSLTKQCKEADTKFGEVVSAKLTLEESLKSKASTENNLQYQIEELHMQTNQHLQMLGAAKQMEDAFKAMAIEHNQLMDRHKELERKNEDVERQYHNLFEKLTESEQKLQAMSGIYSEAEQKFQAMSEKYKESEEKLQSMVNEKKLGEELYALACEDIQGEELSNSDEGVSKMDVDSSEVENHIGETDGANPANSSSGDEIKPTVATTSATEFTILTSPANERDEFEEALQEEMEKFLGTAESDAQAESSSSTVPPSLQLQPDGSFWTSRICCHPGCEKHFSIKTAFKDHCIEHQNDERKGKDREDSKLDPKVCFDCGRIFDTRTKHYLKKFWSHKSACAKAKGALPEAKLIGTPWDPKNEQGLKNAKAMKARMKVDEEAKNSESEEE